MESQSYVVTVATMTSMQTKRCMKTLIARRRRGGGALLLGDLVSEKSWGRRPNCCELGCVVGGEGGGVGSRGVLGLFSPPILNVL